LSFDFCYILLNKKLINCSLKFQVHFAIVFFRKAFRILQLDINLIISHILVCYDLRQIYQFQNLYLWIDLLAVIEYERQLACMTFLLSLLHSLYTELTLSYHLSKYKLYIYGIYFYMSMIKCICVNKIYLFKSIFFLI
jgi:hypothetical protein